MEILTCDVCRQAIEDPVPGRNFFQIAHRELCEPCHDILELQIKPVLRTKQPFNYEWYTRLVQDSIEKAIEKGKFDIQ